MTTQDQSHGKALTKNDVSAGRVSEGALVSISTQDRLLDQLVSEIVDILDSTTPLVRTLLRRSLRPVVYEILETYLNSQLHDIAYNMSIELGILANVNKEFAPPAKFYDIIQELKGRLARLARWEDTTVHSGSVGGWAPLPYTTSTFESDSTVMLTKKSKYAALPGFIKNSAAECAKFGIVRMTTAYGVFSKFMACPDWAELDPIVDKVVLEKGFFGTVYGIKWYVGDVHKDTLQFELSDGTTRMYDIVDDTALRYIGTLPFPQQGSVFNPLAHEQTK